MPLTFFAGMVLQTLNQQHSSVRGKSAADTKEPTTESRSSTSPTQDSATAVATKTVIAPKSRATVARQTRATGVRRMTTAASMSANARPLIVTSPRRQKSRRGKAVGIALSVGLILTAVAAWVAHAQGFFS